MDHSRKTITLAVLAGAVGTLLLLALIGISYVYAGAFNVAATEEHPSLVRWAFDTTFHRSVRDRASEIQVPADLDARVERGAQEYKEMCEHCHGGPGAKRDGFASGMRPQPPHLQEAAPEWAAEEVFWLVKHGARMTGMPAMSPEHYATLGSEAPSHGAGDSHTHGGI